MLVKYYIPSKERTGLDVNSLLKKAYSDIIKRGCAVHNGGYTEYRAKGGYLSKTGLIEEDVTVIETFGGIVIQRKKIAQYCKLLDQECLAFSIDNKLELIEREV